MSIMTFLEASIGVVFAFLVVSLLVTAINELVAARLSLRAKQLEEGIRRMLGGDAEMTARLFSHPLILLSGKPEGDGPSYIKKEHFAECLLDLVSGKGDLSELGGAYKVGFNLVSAVATAPLPAEVRSLLDSFAQSAQSQVSAFKAKVEAWFDSNMERVSGWYSKKVRAISFLIGLAVACAANVDTIAIASRLAVDDAARGLAVSQAMDYLEKHKDEAQTASSDSRAQTPEQKIQEAWDQHLASLSQAGLVGWGPGTRLFVLAGEAWYFIALNVLLKILGLIVTAAAVSLGAPFWFDLLGKLANIRTSLQPEGKGGGK